MQGNIVPSKSLAKFFPCTSTFFFVVSRFFTTTVVSLTRILVPQNSKHWAKLDLSVSYNLIFGRFCLVYLRIFSYYRDTYSFFGCHVTLWNGKFSYTSKLNSHLTTACYFTLAPISGGLRIHFNLGQSTLQTKNAEKSSMFLSAFSNLSYLRGVILHHICLSGPASGSNLLELNYYYTWFCILIVYVDSIYARGGDMPCWVNNENQIS